jgi:hypothetical protein
MRSYGRSPDFRFARLVLADDAAVPTGEDHGWNFEGYERALFQLVCVQVPNANGEPFYVGGGAVTIGTPTSNPVAEAFFWNRYAGIWLKGNPAVSYAAPGAGVQTTIDVPVAGRRTTLKITGVTATQGVLIYAAAYNYSTME